MVIKWFYTGGLTQQLQLIVGVRSMMADGGVAPLVPSYLRHLVGIAVRQWQQLLWPGNCISTWCSTKKIPRIRLQKSITLDCIPKDSTKNPICATSSAPSQLLLVKLGLATVAAGFLQLWCREVSASYTQIRGSFSEASNEWCHGWAIYSNHG